MVAKLRFDYEFLSRLSLNLKKKVFILSMLLGIYITWGKCKKQRLYK